MSLQRCCGVRCVACVAIDGAHIFEQRLPDENGRIQTYLDGKRRESQGISTPLLSLLAADAVTIAERTPPDEIVSSRRIAAGMLVAVAALAVLVTLLVAGPAYWGFGSRHLLLGMELPRNAVPVRSVTVTPGNATVRRNSDLAIRAAVEGFHPREVQVFVRFADRQDWERAPMQPATDSDSRFEFRLYAVRGPLQYYVDAEGTRSGEHNVTVVDLPRIERVQLTYEYPQWTGLEQKVDDESRDIRAVEGTNVKVEVIADAPLDAPALIVDGTTGELVQQGRTQHRRDRGHEARPLSDRRARRQRVRGAERRVRDRDRARREADHRDPQARPRLARHAASKKCRCASAPRTISGCATFRCATR